MSQQQQTSDATTQPDGVSRRAEGVLLLTTLIWGGTFTIVKSMLGSGLGPVSLMTWRFGLAALLFGVVYARRIRRGLFPETIRSGFVLGFLLYLGFGLQTLGLEGTSSSRSGFITALYVIFTPILQTLFTRRAPSRRVMVGVALVIAGLVGLTAPGGTLEGVIAPWKEGGFAIGEALTLGCALAFAIYIIVLDRVSRHVDFIALTGVQFFTVAACSAIHLAIAETPTAPGTAMDWIGMLYLAVLATVLTTAWQTRYQRDTTPTRAAVIFTMESVFAAIFAAIFLGEWLGPVGMVGGVFIVTGLLVTEIRWQSKR
jgi:drug/metabolite transporter (DMT)-like permease